MIYGGGFSAFRGTLGTCTAFGLSRNDQHMSVMAFNGSPDPVWHMGGRSYRRVRRELARRSGPARRNISTRR